MGGRKGPLTAKQVTDALDAAGFTKQAMTATSHTKWQLDIIRKGKPFRFSVTVSEHNAPFDVSLVKKMAQQAGMSVKQMYELCSTDGLKKAKKGQLRWLEKLYQSDVQTPVAEAD